MEPDSETSIVVMDDYNKEDGKDAQILMNIRKKLRLSHFSMSRTTLHTTVDLICAKKVNTLPKYYTCFLSYHPAILHKFIIVIWETNEGLIILPIRVWFSNLKHIEFHRIFSDKNTDFYLRVFV